MSMICRSKYHHAIVKTVVWVYNGQIDPLFPIHVDSVYGMKDVYEMCIGLRKLKKFNYRYL